MNSVKKKLLFMNTKLRRFVLYTKKKNLFLSSFLTLNSFLPCNLNPPPSPFPLSNVFYLLQKSNAFHLPDRPSLHRQTFLITAIINFLFFLKQQHHLQRHHHRCCFVKQVRFLLAMLMCFLISFSACTASLSSSSQTHSSPWFS